MEYVTTNLTTSIIESINNIFSNIFSSVDNGIYNILDEIDCNIDKKSLESIASMLNSINMKDKYTYGHSERVVIYAKKFATYLQLKEKDKKNGYNTI